MLYPYANWRPNVVSKVYPGQLAPIGVLCHYTAQAEPGVSAITWAQTQTGAHFLVHLDGTVDQFVDTSDFVWHAHAASRYYIGIEHVANPVGPAARPPYAYLNETQLSASACLVAWLSIAFGFPIARSFGCPFTPGVKAHFDGLEPGCTWNKDHYDGIWPADVDWLDADRVDALSYSPWTWESYAWVTEWYASWWRDNWPRDDASYWWYGPTETTSDPYYANY